MPSISPISILCDLKFVSCNKKLPVDWEQPTGDPAGDHYAQGHQPAERTAVPEPLCYFWCASTTKFHVETCKDVGKLFKDFAHEALDKTKAAFDMWRLQAKFKDLKVMSVCAIGTPGCLDAPELKDCYIAWSSTKTGNAKAYAEAVEKGVSKCVKEWADKVMVPGLPWYPAFAAYPLASAAPVPNIPMPLITCPSPNMAKLTPDELGKAMADALSSSVKDEDGDKQYEALFDSIGTALSLAFIMWLPQQQIMNVLGKGPVPTYAPPYVPVGPVVAGDNIAIPGHLAV